MTLPAFSQVKGLFWQHPQRDSNAPITTLEDQSERHPRWLMAPHGPQMNPEVLTRQHLSAPLAPSVAMQATERSPSFMAVVMNALSRKIRRHGQGPGARYEFFLMHASSSQLRKLAAPNESGQRRPVVSCVLQRASLGPSDQRLDGME